MVIERITDEEDPWAQWEVWNRENQAWLFVGLILLIIPGLFSLLFLGRGLSIPAKTNDPDVEVEKEYWISSDTDSDFGEREQIYNYDSHED